MGRDGDVTSAGVALGWADELAIDEHHSPADLDPPGAQVDVAAAELGELTEAHGTPGRQQRHQLVAVRQLFDDEPQLLQRRRLHVVNALVLPAPLMWAGLCGISGFGLSEAALAKMVRRRLWGCSRMVSRPGARASYHSLTSSVVIRLSRSSPKVG